MRPKSLILLALALGCGLVASIGISQVLESRRNNKTTDEQVDILVALKDIELNDELSDKNVTMKPWPKSGIPAGAITDPKEVLGLRPNAKIVKDEAILQGKVGGGEGNTPASRNIPAGYGITVVRMDNATNTGLIMPGDRVDVQVFVNKGANVPEAVTTTFLHDVSVFAVNAVTRSDPNSSAQIDAKNVSLLVTPEQAAKVTLAAEIGTIRLFLRGPKSDKANTSIKIGPSDIFGGGSESAAGAQHAPVPANDSLKVMLDKAVAKAPETPHVEHKVHRMILTHGTESHVEELYEGELLPRRATVDGQPATDGVQAPPSAPASNAAPAGGDEPHPAAEPDNTTPIKTPAKPASAKGSSLQRVAPAN